MQRSPPSSLRHTSPAEPRPHVSHPTRHWCFGYSLRPGLLLLLLFFSLCTVCLSLSLTCCGCCCLSSSVSVPLLCSLPRGRRNVRARSQVLCLIAGRDNRTVFTMLTNISVPLSCWHSCESTVVIVKYGGANTNTSLVCLVLFYTLIISYLNKLMINTILSTLCS